MYASSVFGYHSTQSGPRLAPGAAQYNQAQAPAFSNHINFIYLPFSLHIFQVSQKGSCTIAEKTSSPSYERKSPFEEHMKGMSGSGPKATALNTTVNFQKFRSEQCLKALSTPQSIFSYCSASVIILLVLPRADAASCQEKE